MSKLKVFTTTVTASLLLAFTPAAFAQTPGELQTMQTFLEIMESYFGIIDATHDVSMSAEKAAIMQMMKIKEVYEERGEKARAVDVLQEVLSDSRSPTIRNAAIMLMSDLLKETGRSDEAIDLLRQGLSENINAARN